MSLKITDNSNIFKNALPQAVEAALEAIGLQAEGYAKVLCPVDTGRLRNSISHDTRENTAYIGTNVEYAAYVEIGTSRTAERPYLKPAAMNHSAEYKRIAEYFLKKP